MFSKSHFALVFSQQFPSTFVVAQGYDEAEKSARGKPASCDASFRHRVPLHLIQPSFHVTSLVSF